MKFEYEKRCNVHIGQKLYGIVGSSIYTYPGIHLIEVYRISYDDEIIIFKINQPCRIVEYSFDAMSHMVFETKEEAENRVRYLRTKGELI